MKKTILILAFSVLGFEVATANSLSWVVAVQDGIKDSGGVALTNTGAADGETALVQLVYAGTNGLIDVANQIGTGQTGDDEVIAYSWIGYSTPFAGSFQMLLTGGDEANNTEENGSIYYIRAWEGASPSIGTGFVPQGATFYGNSETYTITQNTSGNPEAFSAGGFSTTTAIPEPTVAALIGLFGGGMLVARRLFSKQA